MQKATAAPSGRSGTFSVWSAIAGAVGGAIVVGAVWGVTAATRTPVNASVASFDGQVITRTALQKNVMSHYGGQTLQQMIDNRLVQIAAKAHHLTATPSAIANAQAAIESAYGITSAAQLASFLQTNGLTQAQFQAILKNQVLEQQLATNGIQVTSKEIAAYYKAHKSTFTLKGSKTPEPLSTVKSQIVADIKQSKAPLPTTLLAELAKKYHLTIGDPVYKSLLGSIENAASAATGSASTSSGG